MPLAASYKEQTAIMGKSWRMQNIIKVPVTLVAEMIQNYHRSEIPFLDKVLPPEVQLIPVYKCAQELEKAVQDLQDRGIESLPYVMPHSEETFEETQIPSNLRDYIRRGIDPNQIYGRVKDITYDATTKKIKGNLYLSLSKVDPKFVADVEAGKIINVSIGFVCDWEGSGEFNGVPYILKQTNIRLGHLAGLVHSRGKCPAGICGINQDQESHEHSHTDSALFDDPPHLGKEYYLSDAGSSQDSIVPCPCKEQNQPQIQEEKRAGTPIPPKYNSPLNSHNRKDSSMAPTIEDLQKQLDEANQKLKAISDSELAAKVTVLNDQVHKLEIKLAAQEAALIQKDKDMEECKEKGKKAVADAEAKYELKQKLLAVGVQKIGDKAIADCCLHDMQLYLSAFDEAIKRNGLPKPDQTDHDKKILIKDTASPMKVGISAEEQNNLFKKEDK